jgi:hypothetical protein
MDGLDRLLGFLAKLNKRGVSYSLSQHRPDTIMVTFTVVGARIEVDFFNDHLEYSIFTGNEDVEGDVTRLDRIIEDFGV